MVRFLCLVDKIENTDDGDRGDLGGVWESNEGTADMGRFIALAAFVHSLIFSSFVDSALRHVSRVSGQCRSDRFSSNIRCSFIT
jgi:hypothetical protein